MRTGTHLRQLVKQTKMIMRLTIIACVALTAGFVSCKNSKKEPEEAIPTTTILEKVDALHERVEKATSDFTLVASLDHHRMAGEEGAYTPPAIATIFSDSETNTALLSNTNQLVGLDLPFKLLAYSEADTVNARLAFTSGDFISMRHGIAKSELAEFDRQLNEVLSGFDESVAVTAKLDSVSLGYGIVKIQSDFDFARTLENLVKIINSQSDTRWFGEIDFQKEAMDQGKQLNSTKLLLFGGPAPGAKAMQTTPRIGLDAFCQKLLVYENQQGEVWVAFNDIVDFSKLYYGTATKPQMMINQRLIATFTKAIKKSSSE